jgi:hypothetical protein
MIRINSGIGENGRIDKLVGREIYVGIVCVVRAFGEDLRFHHVVDELMGVVDVLSFLVTNGNGQPCASGACVGPLEWEPGSTDTPLDN